ncbi:SWI/SNF and RSC complex subunit Ssr3 [Coniosporium apollinis]|uniref:SWI/SNF and RSC complex subunit Ssr3 n=1 Tax=Coniosporium apollinis TaxID=61459 RepID=A0ABQ9NZ43_9PEZI|nr:SWI/SNF and RSC complex subunit Ssr3 [Coniosporium apollinis]
MQAQYRNYPPTVQRSPHATQARRGPGPVPTPAHPQQQQQPTPQQMQAAQAQEAQRRELARRQARKPTDRNIPDGVEDIVIGDGVQRYRNLREVERRLDAVMMRKRLDMQDSMLRNQRRLRTMRIWISNTANEQPWQQTGMDPENFDFGSESNATYRVKIEGRLLPEADELAEESKDDDTTEPSAEKDPDAMEQEGEDSAKKSTPSKPKAPSTLPRTKLSHFFKSITIDFDRPRSLQPDGFAQIEWKRPESRPGVPNLSPEANFDTLEFERKSDENINITINLVRDETPERYRLSRPLAELLDTEEADRAEVVMGIWTYVRTAGLQEDEESRRIHCDARMRAVFNTDTLFFPHIPELILPHLTPPHPLSLPYTIRVDSTYIESGSQPTIYDILVPTPDPLRVRITALTSSPTATSTLTQLVRLDDELALTVQALAHEKAKHSFFGAMSRDPVGFTRRWISSQRRDMAAIVGDGIAGWGMQGAEEGEEWRGGGREGVWGKEVARESVGLWLARGGKAH